MGNGLIKMIENSIKFWEEVAIEYEGEEIKSLALIGYTHGRLEGLKAIKEYIEKGETKND